jgi:hypothetical protein
MTDRIGLPEGLRVAQSAEFLTFGLNFSFEVALSSIKSQLACDRL